MCFIVGSLNLGSSEFTIFFCFEVIINSCSNDILSQVILSCEGWPTRCLSTSLYSLDTRSTPCPTYDNQNCLQMNIPWETNLSLVKSHCSRGIIKETPTANVTTLGTRAQPDGFSVTSYKCWILGPRLNREKGKSQGLRGRLSCPSKVEEVWVTSFSCRAGGMEAGHV